jgi:hypothetical protein
LPGRPRSSWRRSLPLRTLCVFNSIPPATTTPKRCRDDTLAGDRRRAGIHVSHPAADGLPAPSAIGRAAVGARRESA